MKLDPATLRWLADKLAHDAKVARRMSAWSDERAKNMSNAVLARVAMQLSMRLTGRANYARRLATELRKRATRIENQTPKRKR